MSATFKIILIGDTGVGKSSLVFRLCEDVFFEDHCPTLGVDFKYAKRLHKGHEVSLQLWDTAGQDQFLSLTSQYYRGCHGVIMCFDLTSRITFEHLQLWKDRLHERLGSELPPTLVLGCKLDLADPMAGELRRALSPGLSLREISADEASCWAKQHQMSYMEISSKDGRNVTDGFDFLIQILLDRHGMGDNRKKKGTPSRNVSQTSTEPKNGPARKFGCVC